jgi:hypothetical protein
VKNLTDLTIQETQTREDKHTEFKDQFRTHNALRAERMLISSHKRNVMRAWLTAARYIKTQRAKTV